MQGAIFDIDGTILDSMGVWNNATATFYKNHGLTLSDEDLTFFQSATLNESFPYMKEKYNLKKSVDEISKDFENIILKEYKYNIPIKPGADVYLKTLKKSGAKLACATSTKPQFCTPALKRLGIFDLFDAFAYSDEVGVNKTNPDIYLLAAQRIGVAPCNCTVFEDIEIGIKSAKSAGFKTCAVYDNSNKNHTTQLKQIADRYILSWQELIK